MQDEPKAWIDRLFWGIICLVALYASDQIKVMSESVQELNKNMGIVMISLSDIRKANEDHENRLRAVERRMNELR